MFDYGLVALYILGMFTLLVAAHEWGHMSVAKLFKMRVEEFALGIGPVVKRLGQGRDGTQYTWRLFPIGGFVKIVGMLPGEEHIEDGFQAKSRTARFLTILAGPLASILLGFVLYVLLGVTAGFSTGNAKPQIQMVMPNTPAQKTGLQIGDLLLRIGKTPIKTTDEARKIITANPGKPLILQVKRGEQILTLTVTPEEKQETIEGQQKTVGRIGVIWAQERKPVGLGKAVEISARRTVLITGGVIETVRRLLTGRGNTDEVGGPIAIVSATSAFSRLGFARVMEFAGDFSVMLGIINLLPIPVLDGGRILVILIEAIRRKKLSPRAAIAVEVIGFSIVVALLLSVISLDLYKVATGRLIR